MTLPRVVYSVILGATVFWCAAILLAPVLAVTKGGVSSCTGVLYAFFSPVCHQIGHRSFHVFGEPLAVCSRCSAIYLGFLLGAVVYPFFRSIDRPVTPPRWLVILAVLPMVLDVLPGMVGLHTVTLTSRVVTGGIFGIILPFVVLPVAIEGIVQILTTHSSSAVHQQKGTIDA